MTFQQLIYANEVAQSGSINKAAQKLFVSQSSISCALNDLESEFQISLFIRSNQGVVLTDEGRHFLARAKSILDRKEEMEEIYSGNKNAERLLSVASQHYQCVSDAFIKVMKGIDLSRFKLIYKETSMDRVINDVYNFNADLGIIITSNITEDLADYYLNKRNLNFNVMMELDPCVFLSQNHPLAHKKTLQLKDLENYPYVTFSHSQEVPIDFSEGIHLPTYKPKRIIETNDRCAMVNILCNTEALSTGSGLLAERITDPRLISIPLEDSDEKMTLGWIQHKERVLSPEALIFLNELSNSIKESLEYTQTIWGKRFPTKRSK